MKVMTVLGTRPEIIRLSQTIAKLDESCEHVLISTGQSFDDNLSGVFFRDLQIRQPNYTLTAKSNDFAQQLGKIFASIHRLLLAERPDRFLVLGDTNSVLSAFIAKRLGIPVYHMEAGNRCFDERSPEEHNRRVIDHCSDIHLPYTQRAKANLLREGIAADRIFVIGNPIYEVLEDTQDNEAILVSLGLTRHEYFLVTTHREENIDNKERLQNILRACSGLYHNYKVPVIFSRYPRTANRMQKWNLDAENVTFYEPFGFLDFLALEKNARCVLTDSGTVQEECCILGVPCVTLRDFTERPETVECGSNILSSVEPKSVMQAVQFVLTLCNDWIPPYEYLIPNVSDTVVKILMGYRPDNEDSRLV